MTKQDIQEQVVFFCKPLLYYFLNTFRTKQGNRVEYILEGAGALEFWVTHPDVVQTLDADIHLWLEKEHMYFRADEFLVKQFTEALQFFFDSIVLPRNQGVFRYFDYMTKWTRSNKLEFLPRWNIRSTTPPVHPTLLVKVYGYDLADIVYDNSYGKANLPLSHFCFTFEKTNERQKLNVLKIEFYVYAQIRILYQNDHRTLLRKQVLSDLGMTTDAPVFGPVFDQPETLILCLPWFKKLSHYYKTHRHKNWDNRDKKRSLIEDLTQHYLQDILLDPQKLEYEQQLRKSKGRHRTVKDRERRCFKVISRLLIILEYFDVHVSNREIVLNYKPGYTSCAIFNTRPRTGASSLPCHKKIEFGKTRDELSLREIELLRQTTVWQKRQQSLLLPKRKCIDALFPYRNNPKMYRETIRSMVSVHDSICRWTVLSSELSAECIGFYFSALTGVPYQWSDESNRKTIENIQRVLSMQPRTKETIIVRKTARYLIFHPQRTSRNLRVGDSLFQYVFNSTCINPSYTHYLQFAGYQTGTCGYIIEIPPSVPFLYIGDLYGGTENEYEVLLPLGIQFRVLSINEDAYVMQDNTWTRVTTYSVRAEWKNESIRRAVMSTDGSIHWDEYHTWISQNIHLEGEPFQVFEKDSLASQAEVVPLLANTLIRNITIMFSKAKDSIPAVKRILSIIVVSISVLLLIVGVTEVVRFLVFEIIAPAVQKGVSTISTLSVDVSAVLFRELPLFDPRSVKKWVRERLDAFWKRLEKPKEAYDVVPTLPVTLLPVGTLKGLHVQDPHSIEDFHSLALYKKLINE